MFRRQQAARATTGTSVGKVKQKVAYFPKSLFLSSHEAVNSNTSDMLLFSTSDTAR
jgi:hypothetical protein